MDVSLVAMPLFHVGGSLYALAGLYMGAHNVVLREVVRQQILDAVDDLPRNPSGKILKRELRERYWRDQTRQVH